MFILALYGAFCQVNFFPFMNPVVHRSQICEACEIHGGLSEDWHHLGYEAVTLCEWFAMFVEVQTAILPPSDTSCHCTAPLHLTVYYILWCLREGGRV